MARPRPAVNANNLKQTPIPVVPRTMPIVNPNGTVTRSGQLLLEQLQPVTGAQGPYIRTLDLFDVTPGSNIAPFVPIFQPGPGIRAIGVLRKAITADLVITITRNAETSPLFTFTLPASTAVGDDVTLDISSITFKDLDVLKPSITASDSSTDVDGVATLTIEWGTQGTSSSNGSGGGGTGGGGGGGGGGGFTAGGDLSGSSTNQTVIGLEGVPLDAATVGTPTNGWVITYDSVSGKWKAAAPTGGGGGGGGSGTWETPTGTLNGTNTTFTLSATPATNSLLLFLDGVEQEPGVDYTLSGATITYAVAPRSTDWHLAYYGTGSGGGGAVSSVFGRTGAVVAVSGDYTAAMVTNAVSTAGSYADPAWITSLAYSKITGVPAPPLTIGFVLNSGAAGTNVGPMLVAPRSGTVSKCVVCVKASDGSTALNFDIRQNGASVFTSTPSIAAGAAGGSVFTFTSLASTTIGAGDVFSFNITSGTSSWQFSAQLET